MEFRGWATYTPADVVDAYMNNFCTNFGNPHNQVLATRGPYPNHAIIRFQSPEDKKTMLDAVKKGGMPQFLYNNLAHDISGRNHLKLEDKERTVEARRTTWHIGTNLASQIHTRPLLNTLITPRLRIGSTLMAR